MISLVASAAGPLDPGRRAEQGRDPRRPLASGARREIARRLAGGGNPSAMGAAPNGSRRSSATTRVTVNGFAVDDELIKMCGLAACIACRRMTPQYLKALSDSVEQACCLPARFAWDRKATAHAEIVNLLADSAADPLLVLLVRNVPGYLYDLMVRVGPAGNGILASSRRRPLAWTEA